MKRGEYIIRRLFLAVVVIISVSIITFIVSRVIPSDPARQWVGPRATAEQIAFATENLGLDLPLPLQYLRYVGQVLSGDLGVSINSHNPILRDLRVFLPATMELVLFAMLLAVVIGIPVGVLAGSRRNSWFDHIARVFSISGTSVPTFWLGLLLILLFFSKLHILPIGGRVSREILLYHPVERITGFFLVDSILTGNWTALGSVLTTRS